MVKPYEKLQCGTENLSLTAHKELNYTNNHMGVLRMDCIRLVLQMKPQSQLTACLKFCQRPDSDDYQLCLPEISDSQTL